MTRETVVGVVRASSATSWMVGWAKARETIQTIGIVSTPDGSVSMSETMHIGGLHVEANSRAPTPLTARPARNA